jgi:hypothetical protein
MSLQAWLANIVNNGTFLAAVLFERARNANKNTYTVVCACHVQNKASKGGLLEQHITTPVTDLLQDVMCWPVG